MAGKSWRLLFLGSFGIPGTDDSSRRHRHLVAYVEQSTSWQLWSVGGSDGLRTCAPR